MTIAFFMICTAAAAALAISIWMALRERKRVRALQNRVSKLYASRLFDEMLPMLMHARKHPVEHIRVDKEGVIIQYMEPREGEVAFTLRERRYPCFTLKHMDAMCVVLEECLPNLRDAKRYSFSRKRNKLMNGNVEYSYCYTMLNPYKAKLNKSMSATH